MKVLMTWPQRLDHSFDQFHSYSLRQGCLIAGPNLIKLSLHATLMLRFEFLDDTRNNSLINLQFTVCIFWFQVVWSPAIVNKPLVYMMTNGQDIYYFLS